MAAPKRARTSPLDDRPPPRDPGPRRRGSGPPSPHELARVSERAPSPPLDAELVPATAREDFLRLRDWLFSLDSDAPFGVPRRFGLGTIFIVTAVFALTFAVLDAALTSYEFPPGGIPGIVSVVAVIGAGQAFLFQGRRPRLASLVSGMVLIPVLAASLLLVAGRTRPGPSGDLIGRGLILLAALGCALVAARFLGARRVLLAVSGPSLMLAGFTLLTPFSIGAPTAFVLALAALVGLMCALHERVSKSPKSLVICLAFIVYMLTLFLTGANSAIGVGFLLPVYFVIGVCVLTPLGAFVGYVSGGIVAGVFLLMDAVETQLEARRAERNAHLATRNSPWDDSAP